MRLEKIKLAGFKSFVEPITIPVTGNLVGIVGPNGCGKSNIIDAVRWVLGEISAKHLRGEKMADVIFNGSSSRKPVSLASVELIFDNLENRIGGEFAKYDSISVKRQVARDGQSVYLLNGSRCRRKDITDMFLGTGVGSRSYAVIEQGTISRLVEAKPDELREFLEEAAGISKYKERRRETELRMKHTLENLERLEDVRDEIGKQLNHLKQQAKKAERYKSIKQEQRQVKQQLLALRWHIQEDKAREDTQHIQSLSDKLKELSSQQHRIDDNQAVERDAVKKQQQVLNEIQGEFYALGSEISRLEQTIKHVRANREELDAEWHRLTKQNEQVTLDVEHDKQQLEQIRAELEAVENSFQQAQGLEAETLSQQAEANTEREVWRKQWDQLKEKLATFREQIEVQRAHIQHLEKQDEYLVQRSERLLEEQQGLLEQDWRKEIPLLQDSLSQLESQRQDIQIQLETLHQRIDKNRQQLSDTHSQLNHNRSDLHNTNGKISSLELLQQHAMGNDRKGVQNWLENMALNNAPRLGQILEVSPGWEKAIEMVLDIYLEAICLEDVSQVAKKLDQIENATLTVLEICRQPPNPTTKVAASLLDQVKSPGNLNALLYGVYCAENLNEAKSLLQNLNDHESVITPDGVWLGPGWIMVKNDVDEKSGVLKREEELRTQRKHSDSLQLEIARLDSEMDRHDKEQRQVEGYKQDTELQLNELNSQWSNQNACLSATLARNEEAQKRLKHIETELEEIHQQQKLHQQDTAETHQSLEEAENKMALLEREKHTLSGGNDGMQARLLEVNASVRQAQNHVHDLKSRIETLKSSEILTQKHLTRVEDQSGESTARIRDIETRMEQSTPPLDVENEQLEEYKRKRSTTEKNMQEARNQLDAIENNVTEQGEARIRIEREIEDQRETLETARVDMQTAVVRRQAIEQQLQEMSVDPEIVFNQLPEDANEKIWQENVERLGGQIERLGTINLTAIEEYETQEERMDYLNRQHQDITESLETLEQAIKKIDTESRARFKDTFDRVNDGLQQKFPKLFGGGGARLELSDTNLLEAGVTVVARPPGKRTSSIHLLSGGEKALTAVALVFSIFELNPAPFCLLDEVDAPLDDANIGRFSQLLLEMAERIQFVFITHNKVTMEIAERLAGITMNEPGVSRLVTVDIDEAVKLAV